MARLDEDFDDTLDVDFDEVFEKDENEKRIEKAKKHKNSTKFKRKTIRLIVKVALVLFVLIYLFSGASNISALRVSGNVIYNQNQVLEIANLGYGSKNILNTSWWIEHQLEKDPLIKNAEVKKTFGGGVYITIEEEKIIGYYTEGKQNYLLLGNKKVIKMDQDNINLITSPYLNGLTKKQREALCKEFKDLTNDDMSLISEIKTYQTSYDKNMLELIMSDGHIVRTDYKGLKLLKNYKSILKGLNSTLQCVYLVEETNSAYSQKCD